MITQQTAAKKSILHTLRPWIIWALGCLFYFYEFLLQVSPSVMSTELMHDFSITSHALGILAGIYFYSYAAMQLPGGLLMDQFGPRRLLTLATAVCAISTLAFGLTDSFYMACLARLAMGLGSAFALIGTLKLSVNWFPAHRFAVLTGSIITIGMLGAIGGETPLALMIDHLGWRPSFLLMGYIGLFLAFLIFTISKDNSSEISPSKITTEADQISLFKGLIVMLKNKQLWIVAIYGGLMYLGTPVFCGLWGVPFLMLKMHITKTVAANLVSLVFVGWAIASPLWGSFSNKIGKRKPPMRIGASGALMTTVVFIYAPIQSTVIMQILLLAFGIFSAGFLTAFSVAKELCPARYVASGLGFMNMMNMIGIALIQPFIGYLLDRFWQGQLANNIRIYPLEAYYIALSLLPLAIFISLILLWRVRETHCNSVN
jgi:MFS family permease